jgi:prepilin-type processing-associated H-X9-DG protein
MQTDAHGGEAPHRTAESNYGFLDGHAETHPFEEVYESRDRNSFMPARVY